MPITAKHFPLPATLEDLSPGDVVVLSDREEHSLALKVEYEGRQDLVLILSTQLGSDDGTTKAPFLQAADFGRLARVDGRIEIRPLGSIGLQTYDSPPPAGSLTVTADGQIYIRVQQERSVATMYVDLATGKLAQPGDGRAFYPSWKICRIDGDIETVLASYRAPVTVNI